MQRKLLLILIMLVQCLVTFAQITADADRVDSTAYTSNIANDPIFVYYSDPRGFSTTGTLSVSIADSLNLTFTWFRFNEQTKAFDIVLKKDVGVRNSTKGECTQNGYMVKVENAAGTWDTAFYAWVFQNEFNISAISVYQSTCEQMSLRTQLAYDEEFEYFDRMTGEPLIYCGDKINRLKYSWESSPESNIPSDRNPSFDAPTVPTIYRLTVEDKYQVSRTKKLEIDVGDDDGNGDLYLKAVKAKFVASRAYVPQNESDSSGQAPLRVQFVDSSENAYDYCWYFYQQPRLQRGGDSLLIPPVLTQIIPDSITYFRPNIQYGYNVALAVKGPVYVENGMEQQCEDYLLKEEYINVDTSFVSRKPDIPNAFTPGGNNPRFTFKDESMPRSIKHFKVKIYNRWGNKIYSYEDGSGDWEGWDGKTDGIGEAPAGVYYYTIYAEGWDGQEFRRDGYVHLFRKK
ncbi:MAG: gliding motility-associated C-terminal domain-containing protein [Salinivirgaceae bacterium]|nr:gliding motility-associated C-terminal domain-containing protein [Salinivirgaceae bacterium]